MDQNFIRQVVWRETNAACSRLFQRQNQVNNYLIDNLQLETVLQGHSGCVNCLDWNEAGDLLASGSDDTKVIIWDVHTHKPARRLDTQHHGNIFSVKFLPNTNDHIIATGAADGHIFLHDVVGKETICAYNVEGRIKRLATTKAEPNVLLSSSEDGIVREYDTREHSSKSAKVLLDLTKSCGDHAECKCVAINPTNPYCIAVGSNDSYVRLYDRRMFDMYKHGLYFTPGHLRAIHNGFKGRKKNLCVTYVAFSPRGNELLVNLGGEQIYIFDIYDKVKPLLLDTKIVQTSDGIKKHNANGRTDTVSGDSEHVPKRHKSCSTSSSTEDLTKAGAVSSNVPNIMAESRTAAMTYADDCRLKGNALFGEKKYTAAVAMYNKAVLLSPRSVIFSNRAAALIKREWDGDFYAALKDCHSALRANPSDIKAHYRLARCMHELGWYEEARSCLKEFKLYHPEHAISNACVSLEKDIADALKEKDNSKKSKKNSTNLSQEESTQRSESFDYKYRYCGHCNTTTDIKEANFFGANGQYVVAGSDEGSFFVWEKETTNLVRIMQADSSIVNCLQPHPSSCVLATSGIDPEVKVWAPKVYEDNPKNVVTDMDSVASENQKRMNTDPFESMLMSMGIRSLGMRLVPDDTEENQSDVMPCRPT